MLSLLRRLTYIDALGQLTVAATIAMTTLEAGAKCKNDTKYNTYTYKTKMTATT